MADPLTSTVRLTQPTVGGDSGLWGGLINTNWSFADAAINQPVTVPVADINYVLVSDGTVNDQARYRRVIVTGAWTASRTVTLPAVARDGWVTNSTTGGFNVVLSTGSGTTASVLPLMTAYYACDGTNITIPPTQPPVGPVTGTTGTFSSTLTANGPLVVNGNLTATGANSFTGASTMAALTTSGILTANGALALHGNITSTGTTNTFSGATTFSGGVTSTTGAYSSLSVMGIPVVTNNAGTYGINISGTAANATNLNGSSVNASFTVNPGFFLTADTNFNHIFFASGTQWDLRWNRSTGALQFVNNTPQVIFNVDSVGNGIFVGSCTATSFPVSSDARAKTEIEEITAEQAIAWVNTGRPVTFKLDGRQQSGFIAQEEVGARGLAVQTIADEREVFAVSDGVAPAGHRLVRNYTMDIAYLSKALAYALGALDEAFEEIAKLKAAH